MADPTTASGASQKAQPSSPLGWLLDPLQPTAARRAYAFTGSSRTWLAFIGLGIALLVASGVGLAADAAQFYFSYLVGWSFCLSLAIGSLFFLLIQHLTKAHWSVVVRRLAEATVWSFPLLLVLGAPILFGMHDLYHWTHESLYVEGTAGYDEILAGKRSYLNTPFWLGRMAFYFVVWTLLAYKLYTLSVKHDVDPQPDTAARLRTVSAWGLPLTGVTTAFASYDVLMSTDPHWFSTMFGVYYFAGGFLGLFCLLVVLAASLQRGGMLRVVNAEHYHDLGKFTFGMTVFWAYIAFSQYMLIWYAGIPEETIWYQHRMEAGWEWHSAALLALHFVVPFLVLLPRASKRILPILSIMAVWQLVMHLFDLHWVVMPVLHPEGGFHWLDLTAPLGLFSLVLGAILYRLSRHALAPQEDQYLSKSLHFHNV
jgi:hypothetical protein